MVEDHFPKSHLEKGNEQPMERLKGRSVAAFHRCEASDKDISYPKIMAQDSFIADTKASLWKSKRCLIICCIVASANMQYGFDSAAIGQLQAMPGFLEIFGYPDPGSTFGYGIDVSIAYA